MSVAYGEQQRNSSALSASGAGGQRELERQYHVVLQDSLGIPRWASARAPGSG